MSSPNCPAMTVAAAYSAAAGPVVVEVEVSSILLDIAAHSKAVEVAVEVASYGLAEKGSWEVEEVEHIVVPTRRPHRVFVLADTSVEAQGQIVCSVGKEEVGQAEATAAHPLSRLVVYPRLEYVDCIEMSSSLATGKEILYRRME